MVKIPTKIETNIPIGIVFFNTSPSLPTQLQSGAARAILKGLEILPILAPTAREDAR